MYFTFNWFPLQENRREREIARAPIAHPSTGKSSDCTSKYWRVAPQHGRDRRTPAPPRSSPPKTDPPKTDLVLDLKLIGAAVLAIVLDRRSIPLFLDRRIWWIFFLLGFVSFVFIYWEMILYICLEAEKMWATSKIMCFL